MEDEWIFYADAGRESPIVYLENDPDFGAKIIKKQIKLGDYAICHGTELVVLIERKTWKDLANSIINEDRHVNHARMLEARAENNYKIIYIIEGSAFPSPDHLYGKTKHSTLEAFLDHAMLRDNCFVIQTRNPEHTAARLKSLVKNTKTIYKKFGGTADSVGVLQKPKILNDSVIIKNMFLALDGITRSNFCAIEQARITLRDIYKKNVDANKIAELKYPVSGRVFGNKIAATICANSGSLEKALAEIPGVSDKKAKLIYEAFGTDLFDKSPAEIANIKDGTRNLGQALANKIHKFLNTTPHAPA